MIQVIPVRRVYVSMSCDWPGCEERIDFPEEYDDIPRNVSRPPPRLGDHRRHGRGGRLPQPPHGGGMTVLLITLILITHTYRKEHQ